MFFAPKPWSVRLWRPKVGRVLTCWHWMAWTRFRSLLISSFIRPFKGWCVYMGVSENSGFSHQIIHFNRVFHYKPSILGYLYFWKHPYIIQILPLDRQLQATRCPPWQFWSPFGVFGWGCPMTDEGKPVEDELLQVPADMVGLVPWTCRQVSETGRCCWPKLAGDIPSKLCVFFCVRR